MYTRQQESRARQEFWTTFGRYMSPVLSSEGLSVNWINYHTGIKGIYFRMHTSASAVAISISLEHPDAAVRKSHFQKLEQLKTVLEETVGEHWQWQQDITVDGRELSRVAMELPGVSIMNKDHWPDAISFLKPRIVALDAFWGNARWSFEDLH